MCQGMIYLAREGETMLTFLNAELMTLSPDYFRVINFTSLVSFPSKQATMLSRFLKLDPSAATKLEVNVSELLLLASLFIHRINFCGCLHNLTIPQNLSLIKLCDNIV